MSYEHVTLEKADHIATLTLNRPEKLNAFNPKMYRELAAAATEMISSLSQQIWAR